MSPTLSLSRKKHRDLEETPDPVDVDQAPIATAKQQVGSTLATKAATLLLLGCLFAGPVGLVAGGLALLSAAGGWPGGLLAMLLFRHKTAKRTFQLKFLLALIPFATGVWLWQRWRESSQSNISRPRIGSRRCARKWAGC